MLKACVLGFVGGIFFGVGHINLFHNAPAVIGALFFFAAGAVYTKSN